MFHLLKPFQSSRRMSDVICLFGINKELHFYYLLALIVRHSVGLCIHFSHLTKTIAPWGLELCLGHLFKIVNST